MYVIFPADELILMTYGAALPRVSPRPTLDCLREPKVPIVYPSNARSTNSPNAANVNATATATAVASLPSLPAQSQWPAPPPTPTQPTQLLPSVPLPPASQHFPSQQVTGVRPPQAAAFSYDSIPVSVATTAERSAGNFSQSLPPTPTRRTSKGSLSKGGPAAASSKRSSVRSTRSGQATPPPHTAYLHPHNLQQTPHPYSTGYKTAPPTPKTSMSNEASNRSGVPATPQQQHRAMGSQRRSVDRSSVVGSPVLQRGTAYDPGYEYGAAAGGGVDYPDGGGAAGYSSRLEYPTGALSRDRSPSIVLEPASNDPTRLSLGSGWGRPMSPMELPPNPPPTKTPSSPSKSRLRPKLHIPLGRLGRSASSDQRESQRLKEDLHLHVENPIFNSENLRQRNFDAFFESGEPVYKLHPRGATTAPAAEGAAALPPLDKYAGMYGAPKVAGHRENSLFARSPREAALKQRSMSDEKYEPPQPREARATSVSSVVPQKDFSGKSSGGPKSRRFFGWRGPRGGSLSPQASMASYNGVLKEYGHSGLTEAFKSQNNVNFKLIKTVSDFTETLSQLYEEHATALQTLVSNYRKKNGELRKERPACHLTIFQAWETFLQEVETDSQASNDVASVLSRQVSRPMLDKSFHRKVQSRKIFTHRESFETIIAKTEEKLSKCRLDYKQCYVAHRQSPTQHTLTEYIDAHNAYVQQLHATNGMLELYHTETVPSLMQELEEIHNDLYSIIADSLLQGADVIAGKASEQAKRYSNLTLQCSSVSPVQDLTNFVRILPQPPPQGQKIPRRIFAPPQPLPGEPEEAAEYNEIMPVLRDELVFDRNSTLSLRPALESLKREAMDLEMQIRQLQDSVDALSRTQTRGIEGQLYNKINELQEDLLLKKFDMRAKQIHLAAIKAQKELFVSKVDPGSPRAERKFSAATAPSMKTKWLKAFRSLKPASGSAAPSDKRNGAGGSSAGPLRPNEDGSHHLQEYTYKKITACDVCSQILRGHTRQGLRCRICKLNAHGDCASQLPRCQPKQKLLRRQKSTSELENRVDIEEERSDGNECLQNDDELQLDAADASGKLPAASKFRQKVPFIDRITQLEFTEIDQIYRVLKQAGELKSAHLAAASASGGGGAEKAVQMKDGGLIGSSGVGVGIGGGGIVQQDIPIVNVPDYPERAGFSTAPTSSVAAVAQAAAARAGRGIRPPPVPMPILGVQIQQQELQQQRGALPVPAQDISSSSDCRLTSVVAQLQQQQQQQQPLPQPPPQYAHKSKPLQQQALPANQSVAHMPTAAYISSGLGINYYTASARNPRGSITAATALAGAQTLGAVAVGAGVGSTPAAAAAVSSSPPSTSNGALGSPYQQLQQKHFSSDASGMRRRLFAGCRQLSGYGSAYGAPGGMRNNRSAQHRSISLPETPHSPRRQKLNLRMKSLSLDSPESTEIHGQMRRRQHPVVGPPSTTNAGGYYHSGSGGQLEHCTPPSNNSRLHSPSSPSHQGRKLLYASRGMRGGSVDLPDDMEKSQSSASTSPCPSPVRQFQKSHRLLPTNLYVVLYNFKARHGDELDLKAGYKVTVIDTSDPDWWKGKLLGRVGYFPSKYCVRLNANEKPLQVTHNLQVSDGERGENMTLLRDQIVIQTGDEVNGMVMVRSADNRQGYCPIKYLQEV